MSQLWQKLCVLLRLPFLLGSFSEHGVNHYHCPNNSKLLRQI